ncbi:MAG: hypothetical protein IT307_12550 [Chloroflexi bacterium]|nr:hypothetical protein [Chloroflexota bacterium]
MAATKTRTDDPVAHLANELQDPALEGLRQAIVVAERTVSGTGEQLRSARGRARWLRLRQEQSNPANVAAVVEIRRELRAAESETERLAADLERLHETLTVGQQEHLEQGKRYRERAKDVILPIWRDESAELLRELRAVADRLARMESIRLTVEGAAERSGVSGLRLERPMPRIYAALLEPNGRVGETGLSDFEAEWRSRGWLP